MDLKSSSDSPIESPFESSSDSNSDTKHVAAPQRMRMSHHCLLEELENKEDV